MSVLSGPIGTGHAGWPSNLRGRPARPSLTLDAEAWTPPLEENGFGLLDFTPSRVRVSRFAWRPEQGLDAIASLEPFARYDLPRPRTRAG